MRAAGPRKYIGEKQIKILIISGLHTSSDSFSASLSHQYHKDVCYIIISGKDRRRKKQQLPHPQMDVAIAGLMAVLAPVPSWPATMRSVAAVAAAAAEAVAARVAAPAASKGVATAAAAAAAAWAAEFQAQEEGRGSSRYQSQSQ